MNQINRLVTQINYRPDIDGLRALAVLAVVFHHLSARLLPGGFVGVDVFFVISGYLITGIISREIAEGQFTFKRFYQRRIRRIFPALFVVMATTMIAGYFLLLPSDYAATLRAVLGTLFFSSNMVFWHDLANGYFAATDTKLNPLLHTWSLGVEEQFYVVFPILLLVCYRYFRKQIIWVLAAGALLTLAGSALLVESKSVAVFFLSPLRAWELLAGALLAYNVLPDLRNQVQREVLASAGLFAILVACFVYTPKTTFPGLTAIAPVFGAVAIIHAGSSNTTLVGRLLQWRPIVYIGLISYSLYLWHWPLIVLTQHAIEMASLKPYKPALLLTSLMMASLSYHWIELPFRHSGTVTRKAVFTSAAVFSLVLAVVSVAGLMQGGFANRFDTTVIKLDEARAPHIPFKECDGRKESQWCHLGASTTTPTAIVWGDSHALAWAPALDMSFNHQGVSAIFAPSSNCAPLFDVQNANKPICREENGSIQNYLLSHPEVHTVIMSAFWSYYFVTDGPLSLIVNGNLDKGTAAASRALANTLQWLRDNGKKVILIGPVPVYDTNIPLMLAFSAVNKHPASISTASEQHHKNSPFYAVVQSVQPSPDYLYLDPISWMCAENCAIESGSVPFYRDAGHLSVAGAMQFQSYLESAISQISMKEQPQKSRH